MTRTVVAALQLRPMPDREANLATVGRLLDEAAARGARIVQLPELFSVPFVPPGRGDWDYVKYAEPLIGPSNTLVAEKSREHRMTVVSSIFERAAVAGIHHNTATIFVNGELRHTYRKSHLPLSDAFPEKLYFRPGDQPPSVTDADGIALSTIICYERHFPELARTAAVQGATVLGIPIAAATGYSKVIFDLELRAHAVFNCLYVLASNRIGTEGAKEYFGGTAVFGPDGDELARACDDGSDELVLAELDLDAIAMKRMSQRPFLRDRRQELYL